MIGAVGSGASGHCIALNNIRNYLTSSNNGERKKFLIDFTSNDNENIISSEGCFACDMNKANKGGNIRVEVPINEVSRVGRRGRRLKNRDVLVGRKRRHKRNHQKHQPVVIRSKHRESPRRARNKRYGGLLNEKDILLKKQSFSNMLSVKVLKPFRNIYSLFEIKM